MDNNNHHQYTNPNHYRLEDGTNDPQASASGHRPTSSSAYSVSAGSASGSVEEYRHFQDPYAYSYPGDRYTHRPYPYQDTFQPAQDNAHYLSYNVARPTIDYPFPTDLSFADHPYHQQPMQQLPTSIHPAQLMDVKPEISGMASSFSGSLADLTTPNQLSAGSSSTKRSEHAVEQDDPAGGADAPKKKRNKRSAGKACVYCRRSHMVCEGGRPCERCIKREISHLCRDFTPPPQHIHNHPHHSFQHHRHADETKSPTFIDVPITTHTPRPAHQHQTSSSSIVTIQQPQPAPQTQAQSLSDPQNTSSGLYTDPNFPASWPLLPNPSTSGPFTTAAATTMQRELSAPIPSTNQPSQQVWGSQDDTELAALDKFMKDLGVPTVPGDFFDFLNQTDNSGNNTLAVPNANGSFTSSTGTPSDNFAFGSASQQSLNRSTMPDGGGQGKGRDSMSGAAGATANMSRIDKYLMAAADQPSGPRASRLAQVIKAKYDAGLLKPYDYVKGYERMNKWMDSGRAAPRDTSRASSVESPQKGTMGRNGRISLASTPAPVIGNSISPESRRRILAALAGFRPKFRQIARTLTNVDLVFVEEAMERWMLEYDRAFASIHTPSCIWRRTGEIQKANQEFCNLTGIPASMFRDGQLCVYELMDEDSAVRYWEGYAKIAFDSDQRSMYTSCTLKIPSSLARHRPRHASTTPSNAVKAAAPGYVPDLTLPQSVVGAPSAPGVNEITSDGSAAEDFREIKCTFSVTIRRDAWGVPVAIMGQWIPI